MNWHFSTKAHRIGLWKNISNFRLHYTMTNLGNFHLAPLVWNFSLVCSRLWFHLLCSIFISIHRDRKVKWIVELNGFGLGNSSKGNSDSEFKQERFNNNWNKIKNSHFRVCCLVKIFIRQRLESKTRYGSISLKYCISTIVR